ncbi:MAG: hypothetical protein RMY64_23210 [Nostoc sp. DedQUE08]|nr:MULTISPECIES: hypothetical protein [unclassified Nostoc]MDZ8068502.1 hypothetical protein [Nostoc sp. DedQUE08]MDZ8094892.1 hypothetical protein [Nostoc sp. DedQUE05]
MRFSVKRSLTLLQQAIALFLRFSAKRSLTLLQQAIALWECNFQGMRY